MRFSHVSGSSVLDVINTIQWRLDPDQRTDDLETYEEVLYWCVESGLMTTIESHDLKTSAQKYPQRAESELDAVISVREWAYGALFEKSADALDLLTTQHRDAIVAAHLQPNGDEFAWVDRELTLATPRNRIVRGLVDFMTHNNLEHLHQCEDRACGWVYLDTSPRRNRRWCVASDCGDRNRARTYYARNKTDGR